MNIEIDGFLFDNSDVTQSVIITSDSDSEIIRLHRYQSHEKGIFSSLIQSFEIIGNGGDRYSFVLEEIKYNGNATLEQRKEYLVKAYYAFEKGFKAQYDDYREIHLV